ncbi:hypothetical protein WOLCODRAFT_152361 [Wolfiporia cocos MD-104 SS10]|uniref:Alcohol acetyltransferase n=1 Tax=Wolfiporia cocos (strain MD-104) TaxID=742152 RepID=A0A2H3K000_WOLCO|nr:hypothetical protein WOLCODRAFT_152361 [Wolfiporia cocos MD-104 SS10]
MHSGDPADAQATPLREAGLLHIARHHLGMYSCDEPTLFRTLARVIVHRHPALCVRLTGGADGRPTYTRLPQIDLTQIVTFTDTDESWGRVVIFAWHDGIGDGASGVAFHRALLSALQATEIPVHEVRALVSVPEDISLIPPLESLADLSVSLVKVCREVMLPTSWTPLDSAWTGRPVPQQDTSAANVRLLGYSPEETSRILHLCKSHHATLTSVLHTRGVRKSVHVDPCLAALLDAPADEMCDEVSMHHAYPLIMTRPPKHTSWLAALPWDTATDPAVTLQNQAQQATEQVSMLKFLFGNYDGYFKGMLGKKRKLSLQLSNLGRFPAREQGASGESSQSEAATWEATDMYFTQAQSASLAAITVNITGTPKRGLGLTITYNPNAVDDAFGESFFRQLNVALDEMAQLS